MAFDEDRSTNRVKHAQETWAALRRLVASIVRQDKSKLGIEAKRRKAGWKRDYLIQLLNT